MHKPSLLIAAGLVLSSTLLLRAATTEVLPVDGRSPAVAGRPECGGEPCDAILRGLGAFLDRKLAGLEGNGRACADCHMPTDSFQLSPASAEARFQLLQWRRRFNPNADDPLFRPVDADDFRILGDDAHDFSNLRQNGLVRITFPLPPNIKVIDPATNAPSADTFVDVWRSVPTVNDVALTGPDGINPWPRGPNVSGGYQLDGRFGTLQEQALAAFTAHAQVGNAPPQGMLDDLASFQRILFTNHRVRALSDALREGTLPLPDADGPLTELEQAGKAVFVRACAQCHGGPGQSTPQAPVDALPRHLQPVSAAGGRGHAGALGVHAVSAAARAQRPDLRDHAAQRDADSPHELRSRHGRLLTGFAGGGPAPQDDWNKLDTPGLRGLRRTAPYFHNNSAPTIEAVVDHYTEFFKRVSRERSGRSRGRPS